MHPNKGHVTITLNISRQDMRSNQCGDKQKMTIYYSFLVDLLVKILRGPIFRVCIIIIMHTW